MRPLKMNKKFIQKAEKMAFGSISNDAKKIHHTVTNAKKFSKKIPSSGAETAGKRLKATGGLFVDNMKTSPGGWKALAGNVGSGAIAGGISGAALNTLRGEDAWEGAKTGAFYGGMGYGGVQAVRAGVKAGASETMVDAVGRFGKHNNVSKDVKTLMRDAKTHVIAKSVTKNKNN